MRLGIQFSDFVTIVKGISSQKGAGAVVHSVSYDSRKIGEAQGVAFFALSGGSRDGHEFLEDAYNKGVRIFVISTGHSIPQGWKDVQVLEVADPMTALLDLAAFHRTRFHGKMVLVSGKIGKTTVKEWLYHFLSPEFKVSRSPKSFNSTLGVALSILEVKETSDVAIIEVKPHAELNPIRINQVIRPDVGVLTSSDSVGAWPLEDDYIRRLFNGVTSFIHVSGSRSFDFPETKVSKAPWLEANLFTAKNSETARVNASLAARVARELGLREDILKLKLQFLPSLALRMETFEGVRGNFVINDAYNLDFEAFRNSLEYQQTIAAGKKRAVIVGLEESKMHLKPELEQLITEYAPDFVEIVSNENDLALDFKDTVILIKGTTSSGIHRVANRLKEKGHKTHVRIDLKALRKNILAHKQLVPKTVKLMAMVKAAGYGSGLDKMVQFVDTFGVDYFGVAYVDEGVEIRKSGISKPVMVMNAEDGNFEACIVNQLEPAIYDFQQLDAFISECIYQGVENYPIHLKIDTGMNRLGFTPEDLDRVLEIIRSQPEVKIRSVYSHLADSDNRRDKRFTEFQISRFSSVVKRLKEELDDAFDSHILNSSGIANFPNAPFSMVRLGIGMYGITSNSELKRKLEPVLSWYSSVSQVKTVNPGSSVGYGRTFMSKETMRIATIPVGYADGFRRSLSNGVGYVYIQGKKCQVVGRVCMDMIMVDVTKIPVKAGDEVELIGPHNDLEKMAALMQTIPYEVMTSISARVHRMYIE